MLNPSKRKLRLHPCRNDDLPRMQSKPRRALGALRDLLALALAVGDYLRELFKQALRHWLFDFKSILEGLLASAVIQHSTCM